MAHILVLNGPNLNLLGQREPGIYGDQSLDQIHDRLTKIAKEAGHRLTAAQSNSESELIGYIQRAPAEEVEFVVFNPAAFTHTSVALRDALLAVGIPVLEVHLTNIHAREAFRRQSYFSDIAVGTITGLGAMGYELALTAAIDHLTTAQRRS